MTNEIIANRRDKFNYWIHGLVQFLLEGERNLVRYAYQQGASEQLIADLLQVSRQSVNVKYPRKKLLEEVHE